MHGTNDWLVGAEIFKGDGALRYLDDPTKDGVSIGSANDYYDGINVLVGFRSALNHFTASKNIDKYHKTAPI